MEMPETMTIVLPAVDEDRLSNSLRALTRAISRTGTAHATQGLLGGEFGYGAEFENETFEMHPFYWGDCECGFAGRRDEWEEANFRHLDTCYQADLKRHGLDRWDSKTQTFEAHHGALLKFAETWGFPEQGCAVRCTCGMQETYEAWLAENDHDPRCPIVLPNFLHKASGLRVDWYKYIGRDMEVTNASGIQYARALKDCLASLKTQSKKG